MHNPKLTIAIITELVTAQMIRPSEGLPVSLVWSGVNVFLLYGASMTLVRPIWWLVNEPLSRLRGLLNV